MYNLLKINQNVMNDSVLGHPLNVICRAEKLEKVTKKISELLKDGYRAKDLIIMKDCSFVVHIDVQAGGDNNGNS